MGEVQGRNGGGSGSSGATRWILLAAFMNVAIVGTVMGLRNSIWFDEACTIFTTSAGPLDAFHRALRFEQQPPLYFGLAWVWRQLYPSVEFLRLLSVLFISGTIFLLWRMSEDLRLGSRWWNLALLGALTPHILWAASEARVYALTLLLVTASTWLFFRLMDEARALRAADLLAYVAVSYLGLLSFYYVGFVLVGHGIAGLLSPRRRALLGAQVAIGVLLLPWMPAILQQFGGRQQYLPPLEWAAAPFGIAWLWQLVEWCGGILTVTIFRATPLMRSGAGAALLLATLALITACRFLPGARRIPASEWRLVVAGGVPVLVLMALRVSNLSLVEERHWIVVVPGILLLLGLALEGTAPGWPRRVAVAVTLLVFAAGSASYIRNYRGQGDWKWVARYLNGHVHAGDPVVFFATDGALPFSYYFPRSNPLYQIPEPDKTRPYTDVRLTPADQDRAREALAEARASGGLWLLEKAGLPPDSGLAMLRRFTDDSLAVTDSLLLPRTRARRIAVEARDQASR